MIYPPNLIPIKGWKKRINVNDVPNFPVVRRIHRDFKSDSDLYIDLGQGAYHIKLDAADVLGLTKLVDLSMNIVSEDSSIDNARFHHGMLSSNGDKISNWNGENVNPSEYGNICHYAHPCYLLVFESQHIHNIQFPYERTLNSYQEFENEKNDINVQSLVDSVFKKNQTYQILGEISLRHDPTPLNYWHIVLDIRAPKSKNPIKDNNSKWKKNMQYCVFDIIRKNISIDYIRDNCLSMNKYYYIENKGWIFLQKIIRWFRIISCKFVRNVD